MDYFLGLHLYDPVGPSWYNPFSVCCPCARSMHGVRKGFTNLAKLDDSDDENLVPASCTPSQFMWMGWGGNKQERRYIDIDLYFFEYIILWFTCTSVIWVAFENEAVTSFSIFSQFRILAWELAIRLWPTTWDGIRCMKTYIWNISSTGTAVRTNGTMIA